MTKITTQKNTGFIALMSAVIISAIMLSMLFVVNKTSFNARFDALDSEFKNIATNLAESCVNQALLKLAQDYNYDPSNENITIGSGNCQIISTTPHAPRSGNSTMVTIDTKGNYKNSFSNFETKVTVANPNTTSFIPLPSCYLWTNADSISSGQTVTLGWNSSNATSMSITATRVANNIGSVTPVAGGTRTKTLTESETFTGTATNSVGSTQCTTPPGFLAPSIVVQPPATCADTVMMLDRTGSMASSELNDEKAAAQALLSLYQGATPPGSVGVGIFGDGSSDFAPGKIVGLLGSSFSSLSSAINTWLASSGGYTNLGDAIQKGADEVSNVTRHDPTKSKVLIIVSDGEANRPNGTTTGNTGFYSPTSNTQNASGDTWVGTNSDPASAYADGGSDANDLVSENDQHRFYNFNFPTTSIPSNATITGIEVLADAWATAPISPPTIVVNDNFGTGPSATDVPNWNENGGTSATQAQAPGSGNDTASPDGGRFAIMEGSGGWICQGLNATGVSSMVLNYYWRGDTDSESSDQGVVEYNSNGSCNSNSGWSTISTHTLTNTSWSTLQSVNLPSSLNNDSSFFLRFRSGSSSTTESFRVDAVKVSGGSTPSTSCELRMDLSYNNGTNFTPSTQKSATLTNTQTTKTFGSSSDNWGRTWAIGDLANNKFIARVHAYDPGTNCDNTATVHLDWLRAQVHYSTPSDPNAYATAAANNAKANSVNIYTIHFDRAMSSATGRNFLAGLASGSADNDIGTSTTQTSRDLENNDGDNFFVSPSSTDMSQIFYDIGVDVCPAAIAPPAPPAPPTPPPPPPPPPNITIGSWEEI